MGAGLGDDEGWREAARDGLRDANKVVSTGLRVSGCSPGVGHAVAAEVQLGKLGSVRIPLKDDAPPQSCQMGAPTMMS